MIVTIMSEGHKSIYQAVGFESMEEAVGEALRKHGISQFDSISEATAYAPDQVFLRQHSFFQEDTTIHITVKKGG
jgi:hypothetical protein